MSHDEIIAELQHDLDAIAVQFEIRVRRMVSDDEAFEEWRDAFCDAFDNPRDATKTDRARLAFKNLFYDRH